MRVVRAILGRFARFLVRIARTLDPALATAPYWVMPERMAALRQRYPGAPEHWLEFVARRAAIGEPAEPHAPPPTEPREPVESQLPQSRSRPRATLRNLLGARGRPLVVFPHPDPRPKARPAAPQAATRTDAIRHTAPVSATRTASRPGLRFSTTSVRNPIANLLRIGRPERRSPMLHFHTGDPIPRDHREAPEHDALARREHQTFFPNIDARPTHGPDAIGANDAHSVALQAEMRWPAPPERASIDASRPNELSRAPRPDPSFRAQDPRWPELPRLAVDDEPSPTPSLNEAILFAEQIGGSWSG